MTLIAFALLLAITETRYISGIFFVSSDSEVKSLGDDFIAQDMNEASGGKWIYPVKQWSDIPGNAITSFAFVQNFNDPPIGFVKIRHDLNEGAGGTYNYLCYQKCGRGRKVTDVTFISFSSAYQEDYYGEWQVYRQNLNDGPSRPGKFVYLAYKTE